MIIDRQQAHDIYRYLVKNDYTDNNDNVTDTYRTDQQNNSLAKLPENLAPFADGIHSLIQSVFDERILQK